MREVALGCALGEVYTPGLPNEGLHEEGGDNRGAFLRRYQLNAGVDSGAAWCAVVIQGTSDKAARILGVRNPLDDVAREALVADYVTLAEQRRWLVGPDHVRRGDLVAFKFKGAGPLRWNHIGYVMDRPEHIPGAGYGHFWTVEGNTGGARARAEDRMEVVRRTFVPDRVCFIAWDMLTDPRPWG